MSKPPRTSRFVVGFLFSEDLTQVLLIQKARPEWQAGRWNGIGGHVEDGEDPAAAMWREFREETGLLAEGWQEYVRLSGPGGSVFDLTVYYATGPVQEARTVTDEEVRVFWVRDVLLGETPPDAGRPLGNVRWLLQMALAVLKGEESAKAFRIEESP